MVLLLVLLLFYLLGQETIASSSCGMVDWSKTFKAEGWSNCKSKTDYINGLWRSNDADDDDTSINSLEKARCCLRPSPYEKPPTDCVIADWNIAFNK